MKLIDRDSLDFYFCESVEECTEQAANAPTIDPVHAAGGCYCRECRNARVLRYEFNNEIYDVQCRKNSYRKVKPDGFCKWGRRREEEK